MDAPRLGRPRAADGDYDVVAVAEIDVGPAEGGDLATTEGAVEQQGDGHTVDQASALGGLRVIEAAAGAARAEAGGEERWRTRRRSGHGRGGAGARAGYVAPGRSSGWFELLYQEKDGRTTAWRTATAGRNLAPGKFETRPARAGTIRGSAGRDRGEYDPGSR